MACAVCNATVHQISLAKLALEGSWADGTQNVDCSGDGSFVLNATRWPAPYHFLDGGVARFLLDTVGGASLLDVGAGSGQYGAWFDVQRHHPERHNATAVPSWRGVDGATDIEAFTRAHGPPGSLVRHANLCAAGLTLQPADWIMSLEVGEHLPGRCVPSFCELLSNTARVGIVLSWARPGQSGVCHVSTREPEWVRGAFMRLGWEVDEQLSAQGRSRAHLGWFKKNLWVLRRPRRHRP